jgi:cyclopropane fatty-acyl-phospholipid synthase-like methyltransferase
MFSYVFMKILEGRPSSYDRGMDQVSRGRVGAIKRDVAAQVAPGSRVLEIGCGTGELGAMLVDRGCVVEGFDQSKGMVKAARDRIAADGLEGKLTVRRMGVDGMDGLAEDSFDLVVSTLVFSELSDDERRFALRHAARALEPGGRLVIADEVVPTTTGRRILHAVARAPALALTYLASGATTEPLTELTAELEQAGFIIDEELRSHGDAFLRVTAHLPQHEEAA